MPSTAIRPNRASFSENLNTRRENLGNGGVVARNAYTRSIVRLLSNETAIHCFRLVPVFSKRRLFCEHTPRSRWPQLDRAGAMEIEQSNRVKISESFSFSDDTVCARFDVAYRRRLSTVSWMVVVFPRWGTCVH